ncbi:MAG: HxsD-like protein [Deltaproteobacteria bacterium]
MAEKRAFPLKFSKRIYPKKAVRAAARAFASFGRFRIREKDGYYVVEVADAASPLTGEWRDEFGNYVLGMTKKCL